MLSKQRRRLVVLSGLVFLAVVWSAPHLPRSFRSEAVIQIRKSLSTAMSEDVGLKPTEAAGQITEDYREVQTGLLQSRLLHEAVGRELLGRGFLDGVPSLRGRLRELVVGLISDGAEQGYLDQAVLEARRVEDAGGFVASGLEVKRGHKSPKITLAFQDDDPERARVVLTTLLDAYQQSLAELYDIGPLLEEAELHRAAAEQAWREARELLTSFSREHDLQDPEAELRAVVGTLAGVVDELTRNELQLEAAGSRAAALEGARLEVPMEFESSPARFENRYRWMLLDLLTLARKRVVESPFIEGTPEYAALQAPVEELIAEYAAEPALSVEENAAMPNTSHYKVVADLALARADQEAAAAGVAMLSSRSEELRSEQTRLASLLPRYTELEDALGEAVTTLADKRDHVYRLRRVKQLGDADLLWSYKVLQDPTMPSGSSSPSRSVMLLGLLVIGNVLAILGALLLGWLDKSVSQARELEHQFGVRPLAAFPDLGRPAEIARLLGRVGRGFLGRLEARRLARRRAELFDFSELGPHSVVIESRMDALIGSIEGSTSSTEDGRAKVVSVGGAHAGAGATTIAVNLARRLSERRAGRTLLALRREGSSMLLSELAAHTSRGSLPCKGSGAVDILLYSEDQASRDWATGLGAGYDQVVIDTPPALASRQSLDLLSSADVALLVARGDVTTRTALDEAVGAVDNAGDAQVGLVLNAFQSRLPDLLASA